MKINTSLNSVRVLSSKERNTSIDIFRAIAIISVVLFHFNHLLPNGEVGVDLFFVISGLLVGGLLTKEFLSGNKIHFLKFFLQRGLKIWPSYFAFLIIGNILAVFFYHKSAPDQIIPLWDIKRYLFLYQNYTGVPYHWSFDHTWSLCVEEHFYILLPIGFIIIKRFRFNNKQLLLSIITVILTGILFKIVALYFTKSKDTYSATHNRIDALAWGVLLNLIIKFKLFSGSFKRKWFFIIGLLLFSLTIYYQSFTTSIFFHKVIFHSIVPLEFFLMLYGLYNVNFSQLKPLRFIAYYSYNWYLWHPIFIILITKLLGNNFTGFCTYILISFSAAVLFTILIEEPILNKRDYILNILFSNKRLKASSLKSSEILN